MAFQTRVQHPSQETAEWPPRDALHYRVEFPLQASHYPSGFPLELSTNSADVISAAEESWGPFPHLHSAEPIHIRIGVSHDGPDELPPPPRFRAQRNLITIVGDAQNFAVCDVLNGFAFSWITPVTAANPEFFRYHFLDVMAGLLLTPIHFAILHAACVSLEGHGVLLCGHSGAGKSTLSFACTKRGWTFISDDAAYALRRDPGRVVIGNPLSLRLRENSGEFFPELRERSVILRQNGEMGFEISTSSLPGFATGFQCQIDHMVFLDRHPTGPAQLRTISKGEAFRRLDDVLDYTLACKYPTESVNARSERVLLDEKAREEQRASVRKLLVGGVHEMRYSNLDSAIECLEFMVRNLS